MTNPDRPDFCEWDERLAAALRALPLPPTPPGLAGQVRRRLRQRKLRRAGAGLAAAVLLATGLLGWQRWPQPQAAPEVAHQPAREEQPVSPSLFAAPPVDRLDVLAQNQAGFAAALRQLAED
jgi:hypothetical protein